MNSSTREHTAVSQLPPWLPSVVAAMLPNYATRAARERAVLHRLTHDERMRDVWQHLARLKPQVATSDEAMRRLFALAYHTAAEGRPVTLQRDQRRRIAEAGGWASWFTSAASINDSAVVVAHMPDNPVAKRFQQTLSAWFERTYGGPHLGLVRTITEVALDCLVSRMAGRLPRKPPTPKRQRAVGC